MYAAFDGMGGLYRPGRWHAQGNRVVYVAASEALAAVEILVHLTSLGQIPEYVCIKAHIPEKIITEVRDLGLPPDWKSSDPIESRALGTRWLRERESAVLRVPSVVIPRESNYAINPEHPDFHRIEIDSPLAFDFDFRLRARVQ